MNKSEEVLENVRSILGFKDDFETERLQIGVLLLLVNEKWGASNEAAMRVAALSTLFEERLPRLMAAVAAVEHNLNPLQKEQHNPRLNEEFLLKKAATLAGQVKTRLEEAAGYAATAINAADSEMRKSPITEDAVFDFEAIRRAAHPIWEDLVSWKNAAADIHNCIQKAISAAA